MPIDINARIYDKLSNKALNKLQKCMYRAVDLIEAFFPDPDDFTQTITLYPEQKDAIDTIQFGYPLRRFRFREMTDPPKGGILMSRRQIGKSILLADTAGALNIIGAGWDYKIPCFCGMVGASEDTAVELIDKTKEALENSEFNDLITGRPKQDRIKLENGSFTRAHPCSEKSIRGKKYHYLAIDEGRWMDEKVLLQAALPTVTHGERWFVITTPQGTKGELTRMYLNAIKKRKIICKKCLTEYDQSYFGNVGFPVKNQIWEMPKLPACENCGNENYKYGIGYIATPWINPYTCPIIDQEELIRKLEYFDYAPHVRQEELGELVDEAADVFLKEWIDVCTNLKLRNVMNYDRMYTYNLGVDYGRLHDASCFCITHQDPITKRIVLDYMRTVSGEYDFEKDWEAIRSDAKDIISFYLPSRWIPDSTGIGYREVEEVQREIWQWSPGTKIYNTQKNFWRMEPEKRRLGFNIDRTNKPQLIGNLRSYLSSGRLELPASTEPEIGKLVSELLRFEYKVHDNGYIEYGTQDFHDDRVIALALSTWIYNTGTTSVRAKPVGIEDNSIPKAKNKGIGRSYAKKPHYKKRAKPKMIRGIF